MYFCNMYFFCLQDSGLGFCRQKPISDRTAPETLFLTGFSPAEMGEIQEMAFNT